MMRRRRRAMISQIQLSVEEVYNEVVPKLLPEISTELHWWRCGDFLEVACRYLLLGNQ